MFLSKTVPFETDSGVTINDAYILFYGASVFSHTVTIDNVSEDKYSIEIVCNVYASESAQRAGKPAIQSITRVNEYSPEQSIASAFEVALADLKSPQ